jgi:hypothetical protein
VDAQVPLRVKQQCEVQTNVALNQGMIDRARSRAGSGPCPPTSTCGQHVGFDRMIVRQRNEAGIEKILSGKRRAGGVYRRPRDVGQQLARTRRLFAAIQREQGLRVMAAMRRKSCESKPNPRSSGYSRSADVQRSSLGFFRPFSATCLGPSQRQNDEGRNDANRRFDRTASPGNPCNP